MKKYLALFRIRFINGLQYRVAALAGLSTQFAWGFMEILAFSAFYRANPAAFPMEFSHLVSYVWIQQAFLMLLAPWNSGSSNAVESIVSGNIAYDLARPMDIYDRWFFETIADRISKTALRCVPVLFVALILPPPFRMTAPSLFQFSLFLISLALNLCVVTTFNILDHTSTFYSMSRYNAIFVITAEFFSGAYVPLPFFPEPVRKVVELTPFAAMQNMPLRIYSGDIAGTNAVKSIFLQMLWFAVLLFAGKMLMRKSLKHIISQGG